MRDEYLIEDDQYRPDTIKQTLSVRGAISGMTALILENRLHACATAVIHTDDVVVEREPVGGKPLEMFRSGLRVGWNRSLPRPRLGVLGDGRAAEPREEVS